MSNAWTFSKHLDIISFLSSPALSTYHMQGIIGSQGMQTSKKNQQVTVLTNHVPWENETIHDKMKTSIYWKSTIVLALL